MLMKVVVENGVKKLVPLTADAGSGNPCGTIIAIYSNQVPYGYLPCNGVRFDTAQFPVLYALLGDDHTPDLRECVLVGSGQSGRTVLDESGHNHDVYTVGQFKDDQLQDHSHSAETNDTFGNSSQGVGFMFQPTGSFIKFPSNSSQSGRTGTTTHGKQVGVNFCIKATSGINENQADNVLSALTPVNEVALNNLQSVTSNAVAENCCRFIDYAHPITPSSVSWTATVDCYITVLQVFSYASTTEVYIDGNVVSVTDSETSFKILAFNGYVKKGQRVHYDYLTNSGLCKIFPLI